MRYILGIDPSRVSGTGLVLLDLTGPTIVQSSCIKLSAAEQRDMDHADQEAFIAKAVRGWVSGLGQIDLVGIEWPPDREKPYKYNRANGTEGFRSLTSNSQWRLLGRLEEALRDTAPIARVTVQQCRTAAGIDPSERRKAVQEIADLTGYPMHQEAKYVAEAVADAASAALAAAGLYRQWSTGTGQGEKSHRRKGAGR